MRSLMLLCLRAGEVIFSPFTVVAAFWLKILRRGGFLKPNFSGRIFSAIGVLPVVDHFYEPLISPRKHLKTPLSNDRSLPGLDLNVKAQLDLLTQFGYNDELQKIPLHKKAELEYHYVNDVFEEGDAEFLYNMIRHFKPARIIEIGSGMSTLLTRKALEQNKAENASYNCEHICIEPYGAPWLEKLDATIIRSKAEDVDVSFFTQLQADDILFIDSSHVIRPQGDVLFEYLNILPTINPGVLVHIHDIFTPKDYPARWVDSYNLLWNEQYLLEAFLTLNDRFEVIGALNFLRHHHRGALAAKCPVFGAKAESEPGSFWIRRKQAGPL